jgi:hypothetical protein
VSRQREETYGTGLIGPVPFLCSQYLLEAAGCPAQVMLVHDGGGMSVGETVLAA